MPSCFQCKTQDTCEKYSTKPDSTCGAFVPTCLQDEICLDCTVTHCTKKGINKMEIPMPAEFTAVNRNIVYTEATLNLVFNDADDCTFKSIRNFESDLLAKNWLKTCESQLRDMGFNKNTLTIHSNIKTVAILIEGKR